MTPPSGVVSASWIACACDAGILSPNQNDCGRLVEGSGGSFAASPGASAAATPDATPGATSSAAASGTTDKNSLGFVMCVSLGPAHARITDRECRRAP